MKRFTVIKTYHPFDWRVWDLVEMKSVGTFHYRDGARKQARFLNRLERNS